MELLKQVSELRRLVSAWKAEGLTVGFVPTMGNLHAGHLSLVHLAQQQCDRVIVSIFVNPLQFGPNEDFEQYPRTFKADSTQLKDIGCHALFLPNTTEMYPLGLSQTKVVVPEGLTDLLEGAQRPGHFDGVTTVVSKLFNMVQPNKAFFGQKDYQQLAVIQQMVCDLALPIEIVMGQIERDKQGLALSSRNQYLTAKQSTIAPKLYAALLELANAIKSGEADFEQLIKQATQQLRNVGFDQIDYIQVCNAKTLLPASRRGESIVILAVARLGKTRLLDNILL